MAAGGAKVIHETLGNPISHEGCPCPRCDCCCRDWEDCWSCGGEGYRELYDDDPLWYDPDDTESCHECGGKGGWLMCIGRCDENGQHKQEPTDG